MIDNKTLIEWYFKESEILQHDLYGYQRGKYPIETIIFGKKGTSINKIYYVLQNGVLMVYGDLGHAIYNWYSIITLEWISRCSIDYFHGKCQASEGGRSCNWWEWDANKAKKYLFHYFKDERNCKGYKKFKESWFINCLNSKKDFHAALHENDPTEIFGEDWWDWLPSIGYIMPIRCRLHLLGLKSAFGKEIK